jgi:hypothetical protein
LRIASALEEAALSGVVGVSETASVGDALRLALLTGDVAEDGESGVLAPDISE